MENFIFCAVRISSIQICLLTLVTYHLDVFEDSSSQAMEIELENECGFASSMAKNGMLMETTFCELLVINLLLY